MVAVSRILHEVPRQGTGGVGEGGRGYDGVQLNKGLLAYEIEVNGTLGV